MIKNDQEVISSKLTNLSYNDKISHCIVIDRSSMILRKFINVKHGATANLTAKQ